MINQDSIDLHFQNDAALIFLREEISKITTTCHRLLLDVQLRAELRDATLDQSNLNTVIQQLNFLSRLAEPIE